MIPLPDLVGGRAGEDFDHVVDADTEAAGLADAVRRRKGTSLRAGGAIVGGAGLEAIVAGGAVLDVAGEFAEILQQLLPPARRTLGVLQHLAELGAGRLLLLRARHLLDEMGLLRDVPRAEEQQAVGGQTVASGAAGFLIVPLDVLGQIVVNDPADVGFVDAHAEGDGGADDPHLVAQEELLVFRTLGRVEAGVIGPGGETAAGEDSATRSAVARVAQ